MFLSSALLITALPFSLSLFLADSNPILSYGSQVREGHLYTENHRRGMYLQMTPDGRVSGSDVQTPHSVLELKSVRPGRVVIRGQSSSLFLCVDGAASLRGQSHYSEAQCSFTELLLPDGYTSFRLSHSGFVSLASKHVSRGHSPPFSRFLLLRNTVTRESVSDQPTPEGRFHLDSDDLLGMGGHSLLSPQFSMDI